MAAPTIYQLDRMGGAELEGLGQLFAGQKFWVAQRVPSRNRLLDAIKGNGGQIVMLEKNADYLIADHFRKDCPPGSISYQFVDKSIQQGEIRDPEDHRCGPPLGEAREPGATNRPAKGARTAYTAEEDRVLYKWVRDAEAAGGLVKGNEIYKQLGAKYPRHPWQSWRDRYIKQLQNRPPSAFNIPDNAPPSPPSDNPREQLHLVASSSSHVHPIAAKYEQIGASKVNGPRIGNPQEDFTVDELAELFNPEDWEELYAFADIIDGLSGHERCNASWAQWAESQAKQTAAQWRQYYEKVVRPQWLRDPAWKREQIKKKIETKYDGSSTNHSQTFSQQQHEVLDKQEAVNTASAMAQEDIKKEAHNTSELNLELLQLLNSERNDPDATAYTLYAEEKKPSLCQAQPELNYIELHTLLIAQWKSLSEKAKAPYIALDDVNKKHSVDEVATPRSEVKLVSSSTSHNASPFYLTDMYKRAMKRMRGDNALGERDEGAHSSRPIKRRKSTSTPPAIEDRVQQTELVGAQGIAQEISSAESSISSNLTEVIEEQSQQQIRGEMLQTQDAHNTITDHMADYATESIESDDFADINRFGSLPERNNQESPNNFPSNTPTPRATRQRASEFDTQAILSSPTQDTFSKTPQPIKYTYDSRSHTTHERSSSPPRHPESDASTTQSLHEFRRSLNEEDMAKMTYPQIPPLPRPTSLSPAPSASSSNGSGDPDIPLELDEIDHFFNEQYAEGFSNDFIVRALKRTRMRPNLAALVLDAWKEGKPLPMQRGIWSIEDDEAVEGGDGVALAKLERKHTVDGWGGITERLIFLDAHRNR
ncbi:hypothetical protein BKA66DRAFT_408698 [Pyrenochaeta sp. MPI-SDFR-AT-0127]|nr:hypothetical protein BKA66DRAFT_408698 [Pyrenochaeta sp. MPI-SDFR-AT-0127]